MAWLALHSRFVAVQACDTRRIGEQYTLESTLIEHYMHTIYDKKVQQELIGYY
jgi:hypothetical protein